jgi:hypothetical protein
VDSFGGEVRDYAGEGPTSHNSYGQISLQRHHCGGQGYRGYRRTVANIAEANWHWQVDVPCPTRGSNEGRLPIRCRGGVFQGEAVEID